MEGCPGTCCCRGLTLNAVVYNPLLVACEASGQLDAALELLAEMRERGISQDAYTYSTLISCCKVGGRASPAAGVPGEGVGGLK